MCRNRSAPRVMRESALSAHTAQAMRVAVLGSAAALSQLQITLEVESNPSSIVARHFLRQFLFTALLLGELAPLPRRSLPTLASCAPKPACGAGYTSRQRLGRPARCLGRCVVEAWSRSGPGGSLQTLSWSAVGCRNVRSVQWSARACSGSQHRFGFRNATTEGAAARRSYMTGGTPYCDTVHMYLNRIYDTVQKVRLPASVASWVPKSS